MLIARKFNLNILQTNNNIIIKYFARRKSLALLLAGGNLLLVLSAFEINSFRLEPIPRLIWIALGIVLIGFLIYLSILDLIEMQISIGVCKVGLVLGIVSTGILSIFTNFDNIFLLIIEHLSAGILALLIMNFLSIISAIVLKKESLGNGDAKVAAMGGAWLGIEGIAISMCIAFTSAGLFSFIGMVNKKLDPLVPFPFAPFISVGIWLVWLFEPSWWIQHWLGLWGI